MHRSGTSVITRGLSVLGVELGRNLLPAQADNVKGFWEDKEIVGINTALMNSCGQDWQTFGVVDVSQQSEVTQQARDYIREAVRDVDVWGFKDPRTARLLPFWNSVFSSLEIEPSYCLVIRNPLSVAESLQVRNRFTVLRSSLLWYQYSMDMLDGLGDGLFTLVDYDEFVENPRVELERMASGLKLRENMNEQEFAEYRDNYLTPGLRHSRYDLSSLSDNADIPDEVEGLYRYFLELKQQEISRVSADLRHRVTDWGNRQNVCRSLFRLINEGGSCEERLHTCEESVNKAEDRLHIARQHVEQTLKERDAVITERDAVITERNALMAYRDSLLAEVEISKNRHLVAVASLEKTQEEMEAIEHQLREQTRQQEALLNSTSWRITSPFRTVVGLIKAVAGIYVKSK